MALRAMHNNKQALRGMLSDFDSDCEIGLCEDIFESDKGNQILQDGLLFAHMRLEQILLTRLMPIGHA